MTNSILEITPVINLHRELTSFLAESNIVDSRGNVYSWVNPRNPGFVYPEIMGLYLNLSSQLVSSKTESSVGNQVLIPTRTKVDRLISRSTDRQLERRSHAIAQRLQKLVPLSGGLGKQGKIYVFDNCMAISGLLAYKKHLGGYVDDRVLSRMADFVVKLLERRQIYLPENGEELKPQAHWSNIFGASMLKNTIALSGLAEETRDSAYSQLASEIAEEVVDSCFERGYFRSFPKTNSVYTHAHCYALEGLLHLQTRGNRRFQNIIEAGVEQLKIWQNDDGSLYNWYNDTSRTRLKVADATSQAIRLWLAISPELYQDNIQRGWQFLAKIQSPQTGLHYHSDSKDRNSWASIFALQAMDWSLNKVYGDRLV